MKDLLEFEVAHQRYAVRASQVKEVLPLAALTPLQDGPAAVAGILRLRGRLVLVVDIRRRLGLPPVTPRLSQCVVVALIGEHTVGILVDAVDGLISVDGPDAAAGSAGAGRIVERIVETGGGVLTVLNAEAIVGVEVRTVIAAITGGHDVATGATLAVGRLEGTAS